MILSPAIRRRGAAFAALVALLALPILHEGSLFHPGSDGAAAFACACDVALEAPSSGSSHSPDTCPVCLALGQARVALTAAQATRGLQPAPRTVTWQAHPAPVVGSALDISPAPPRAPPVSA